jgi:tRNA(Ile2)-agmatinylcytidine synthase
MRVEDVHLGLDDIDSPKGGCTTHFASMVVQYLSDMKVDWNDYPNLIRLNPGIPFRTRGNGAVALRFKVSTSKLNLLMRWIKQNIEDYVDRDYPNTNPGVVIVKGEIPTEIKKFSERALWRTIPIAFAKRIITELNLDSYSVGNGRGLIGALSAIGNCLEKDHTFEYIAYRPLEEANLSRGVDRNSVIEMDKIMGEEVFANIDESNRVLIEPHGPDPVLYGIRGETPETVIKAAGYVRSKQSVNSWMVFRTNQGTGEHLTHHVRINDLRPYMAAIVRGVVIDGPRMIEGGHVIFSISDETSKIDCASYEPTQKLRMIVKELRQGDKVNILASVRPMSRTHGLTLNIEGLEILQLAEIMHQLNPICPHCLKRMKSAGKNKGYKCISCGYRDPLAQKINTPVKRNIRPGLYLPPLTAQRHLTRSNSRLNKHNEGIPDDLVTIWHSH